MKILTTTVLFIFLILLFPLPSTAKDDEGIVIAKKAKVYSKPETKAKVVKTLSKGDKITVKDEKGDWYQIDLKGKDGWIQKKNVTLGEQSQDEEKPVISKQQAQDDEEDKPEQKEELKVSSYSKKPELSTFMVGLRLGFNIASLSGDLTKANLMSTSSRLGLVAGGIILWNFNDMFALQPEILYSQKGAKNGDSTIKFDYLEVPVLVKFNVPLNIPVKPFVTVGPYIGYNLNRALKTKDSTYVYADSSVNKIDFGLSFGIGASYRLFSTHDIMIDFRYNLGLTTIHKASSDPFNIKNRAFLISIGYVIGL